MADTPTTHYLNADFDLSLRPRPRQVGRPKLIRQVRELSVQALLGASASDSVLVRADLPEELLEHLDRNGLPVPTLLPHPRIDPSTRFRPFGWNAEAEELNRAHERPAAHPDLAVARRVNSRSYALDLEQELVDEASTGRVVESLGELLAFLTGMPADRSWVVKSEHGNAGLANRRLARPHPDASDLRFVGRCFDEDDRLLIEPWLPRERDLGVIFDAPFDPRGLRVHETVCTADGGLIGALFEPDDGRANPRFDDLGRMAETVAARLVADGYFGPVCVDAFTWRDGERSRLRPLVDLNCRLSMFDLASRFKRRSAPERTVYYRFFNRGKIDFPERPADAMVALGERGWNRDSRRGILPASPSRLGAAGESWRTGKLAFLFVADGREAIFALERWFRERFED